MKLIEAIRDLESLDEKATIYAAEPWTTASDVVIAEEPESGGLPIEAARFGMKYFLEIFIARDFIEDWSSNPGRQSSLVEKCERLIQYALHDA